MISKLITGFWFFTKTSTNVPKQIKAAVNTNVPTTKVDITAPVMPDIDSWKMAKDVKVQYSTDRTFVAEALLSC